MSYLFSGNVELTADDKNRFRFPAKYKDAYVAYNADMDEVMLEEVYILKTLNANYLTVMPKDIAEKFIAQLQTKLFLNETRETKIAKYYIANMESSKVDSQGRFVVSQKQKGSLNLGKEIVMVGMGNRIEIWNKADYEASMLVAEKELEATFTEDESVASDIDRFII